MLTPPLHPQAQAHNNFFWLLDQNRTESGSEKCFSMFNALLTAKTLERGLITVRAVTEPLFSRQRSTVIFAALSVDFVRRSAGNKHLVVFPSVLLAVRKSDWFESCAVIHLKSEQLQHSESVCNEVELERVSSWTVYVWQLNTSFKKKKHQLFLWIYFRYSKAFKGHENTFSHLMRFSSIEVCYGWSDIYESKTTVCATCKKKKKSMWSFSGLWSKSRRRVHYTEMTSKTLTDPRAHFQVCAVCLESVSNERQAKTYGHS